MAEKLNEFASVFMVKDFMAIDIACCACVFEFMQVKCIKM